MMIKKAFLSTGHRFHDMCRRLIVSTDGVTNTSLRPKNKYDRSLIIKRGLPVATLNPDYISNLEIKEVE